jgi:H+/Cl- antiporter ClcA
MIEIKQNEFITGVIAGVTAGAVLIVSSWISKIVYRNDQSLFRVSFEVLLPFVILLFVLVFILYRMSKRPRKRKKS